MQAKTAGLTTGATGSGPGGHLASGGYASYGMYLLGDKAGGGQGPDEYVVKGTTTTAAERIIGGRINDQVLLSALQAYAGSRQMNYYDQRRMEVPMSKDNRAAYKQGAMDALREIMR
jgi:hypothetical protein